MLNEIREIEDSNDVDWLNSCRKIKKRIINNKLDWSLAFPFYIWNIWLSRNHNYHNNTKDNIPMTTPYERTMEFIHLTGKDTRGKCNTENKDVVSWDPPNYGYKLNIDGSFNHNTKIGEHGVFSVTPMGIG